MDAAACQNPANPVVAENCQSGTDEWIVKQYAADTEIYASKDSVNVGDSLDFFVDTPASTFDLYIYRNGYYGGLGGRLITSEKGIKGTKQPDCARYEDTGLRTCSNWKSSYTLQIPADWVSGIYIARIEKSDNSGGNETVFVVRQDDRHSEILYQDSVSTFQAYNNYGGKSVYVSNSSVCPTIATTERAVKVSLNRPYSAGNFDPNYYYRAEYPMVRWLEQQGYDVAYSTSLDTDASGQQGAKNHLLDHKTFLAVGHDEYWSQGMRDAVTAARDAGINIGLFTANTGYWRVRFEPDPLTNEPNSVMVVYKTSEAGPADPVSPTTTWRDPNGANDPENNLNGVMYVGDNDSFFFPMRITSNDAMDQLYRHTGLQNMPPNSYINVGNQVVGWEWDAKVDNGQTPSGLKVIASSPTFGELLQDAGNYRNNNLGMAQAQTSYYKASSGALVFASGTIQWSWGLGAQATKVVNPDPIMEQVTYNVLSDMGSQPATPDSNIITDGSNKPDPALPQGVKSANSVKPPVISNIQSTTSGNSATITWDTDVDAIGQIWYGDQDGHVIYNAGPETDYTQHHSISVGNLTASKTYPLQVASASRDWGLAISDVTSFKTATPSITGRISDAIKPLVNKGGCFVRTSPKGAVLIGGGVVLIVLVVVGFFAIRRRRRIPPAPAWAQIPPAS